MLLQRPVAPQSGRGKSITYDIDKPVATTCQPAQFAAWQCVTCGPLLSAGLGSPLSVPSGPQALKLQRPLQSMLDAMLCTYNPCHAFIVWPNPVSLKSALRSQEGAPSRVSLQRPHHWQQHSQLSQPRLCQSNRRTTYLPLGLPHAAQPQPTGSAALHYPKPTFASSLARHQTHRKVQSAPM